MLVEIVFLKISEVPQMKVNYSLIAWTLLAIPFGHINAQEVPWSPLKRGSDNMEAVSYTHLRAHET